MNSSMVAESDKIVKNNNDKDKLNDVKVKTIGTDQIISSEPGKAKEDNYFSIIKKIIVLVNQEKEKQRQKHSKNQNKIQLLFVDRIIYKVDKLLNDFSDVNHNFKCGKIQYTKSEFVQSLEKLPINVLEKFYELCDYDSVLSQFESE